MGTDKALAEFVVRQISLWTGYGKVAETGVDARPRHRPEAGEGPV